MTADADPLSSYRWSARPLIVFAEDESDTNLQTMRQALTRDHCEVADRDMVIIEVLEQSAGSAGAQPIDASVAALLRHKFHIKEGTFGVILVGKDGGEKFRTSEPPVLDEIFMLIDGMPMRRREIKFTGAGCEA